MKKITFSLASLKAMFAYGPALRPIRDWFLLMAVASLLLIASMAWSVYIFSELENGKVIGSSSIPALRPAGSITGAQDVLQERSVEEQNYQTTYHLVDPSLPSS